MSAAKLTMDVAVRLDQKGLDLLKKIGAVAFALKHRKLARLVLSLTKHVEVVEISRERRAAGRGQRRDRIGRKLKDRRHG